MTGIKFDKEARAEQARAFFKEGYNCCQAVVMAYADVTGLDREHVATLASGFGGGFGRLREVCGCVSGMTMIAGAACSAADPGNQARRAENYALVQEMAARYAAENGSIICRELLGLSSRTGNGAAPASTGSADANASACTGLKPHDGPMPSERTAEYYRKRPCPELCACAARIIADVLNGKEY